MSVRALGDHLLGDPAAVAVFGLVEVGLRNLLGAPLPPSSPSLPYVCSSLDGRARCRADPPDRPLRAQPGPSSVAARCRPKSPIRSGRTQGHPARAAQLLPFQQADPVAAERGRELVEHVAPAARRQVELRLVAAHRDGDDDVVSAAVGARALAGRKRLVRARERLGPAARGARAPRGSRAASASRRAAPRATASAARRASQSTGRRLSGSTSAKYGSSSPL